MRILLAIIFVALDLERRADVENVVVLVTLRKALYDCSVMSTEF